MTGSDRDDLVAIVAAAIRGGGADIATAETIADAVLDAGWASEDTAAAQVEAARDDGANKAIELLAVALGIDKNAFSWDAATETWEGDVSAVIWGALTAALGEDFRHAAAQVAAARVEALRDAAETCDKIANVWRTWKKSDRRSLGAEDAAAAIRALIPDGPAMTDRETLAGALTWADVLVAAIGACRSVGTNRQVPADLAAAIHQIVAATGDARSVLSQPAPDEALIPEEPK